MNNPDQVYINLQRHLDKQPVGFPATRSGIEIKVLKHIFSPQEAEIATCLSFKPEPLETIFTRANPLVDSIEALAAQLDEVRRKGGIEAKTVNGKRYYNNIPLVVGMYEMQLGRLTFEFLENFDRYIREIQFGIEFLSTKLPQMRTIPVAKSIQPRHRAGTFDEVTTIIQQADAPFAVVECICRKKKQLEGACCSVTQRQETCLTMGSVAALVLENGFGREISREQVNAVIEQNQKEGLVLQPANTEKVEFICSCCGCCCGLLLMHQALPRPQDFWATNFYAAVDVQKCDGCGVCVRRCQVGAVSLAAPKGVAIVDRHRCLGCGVCVPTCPVRAITLQKKAFETRPPQTREALYDIIMAHKKGPVGKLKLTGKLFFDALRGRRSRLLKPFPIGTKESP